MWTVEIAPEFDPEVAALTSEVRIELFAQAKLIEQFGPQAKRPRIDTLKGSKHANMKELRFDAGGGAWLLRSILDAVRSCWLPATNRGSSRAGSTRS